MSSDPSGDKIFSILDVDGNDVLTVEKLGINSTNSIVPALSEENAVKVLELWDEGGDGSITRAEFENRVEDGVNA